MTAKGPVAAAPTTGWRNRITGSGEEAPDQLLANPANWRIHRLPARSTRSASQLLAR